MKSTLTNLLFSFFFISSILLSETVSSQEIVNQLDGNPLLKNRTLKNKNLKASLSDTLELPFFDDFSDSYYYPDEKRWADNYAFINTTYPVNPPSIGVATMDAINNKGEFYEKAGYGNYFSADSLSSLPINLNFPGDNSIYLSFYYQAKGLGDLPEIEDSLLLEFYAPIDSTWEMVWYKLADTIADFRQEIIQITDSKYQKKGFRFRFRNIASLSGDKDPSRTVNADHWHIDYVYLNKGRTANDTTPDDMAFVYPMITHLKRYESMPWKHFLYNTAAELATNTLSIYQNNSNGNRLVDSIYVVFYDNSGNEPNDTLFGGSYNVAAKEQKKFNPPFTNTFLTNSVDSASFNIKTKFVTNYNELTLTNNVITYVQRFYDYYSYDDGTAEAGYGLIGEGAQNARLAYQFDCVKQDTLKAIQMYFNRSLKDKSQKYFYLTIWDDNAGEPGQIIYQREAVRPEYEDELNKFHTYFIDDTTLVINRVFYVGWVQTTADMLNIGLDFNRKKNNYIFYNINGDWSNSSYEAALMIRPIFGKTLTTDVIVVPPKIEAKIKIYPNPAEDQITIEIGNYSDYEQLKIEIYTMSGTLVYQSEYKNQTPVYLSNLKEGMYLLRLSDNKKKLNYTQKFIKSK